MANALLLVVFKPKFHSVNMFLYPLILIIATVPSCVFSGVLKNPTPEFKLLLHPGENLPQPFALLWGGSNGTIIAASKNTESQGKLPFFDFQNRFKGYAFTEESCPKWSAYSFMYLSPELRYIPASKTFLLYFSATHKAEDFYGIGLVDWDAENGTETSKSIFVESGKHFIGLSVLVDSQGSGMFIN